MRTEQLGDWIDRYERAWRSAGTQLLDGLFRPEASYRAAPFEEPISGRGAIAAFWEAEREGPDESLEMSWEPVALDGDVGVARVEVRYDGPALRHYRDLWIVRLDDRGLCVAFEEWPFFSSQPRTAR